MIKNIRSSFCLVIRKKELIVLILSDAFYVYTVKLGNKERIDKEQIGIKEPFPVTNLQFTS